jgi:hypothetical protein
MPPVPSLTFFPRFVDVHYQSRNLLGYNPRQSFFSSNEMSNVVALDEAKPHTLPSGTTFFRVNESLVGKENLQVDKYILSSTWTPLQP